MNVIKTNIEGVLIIEPRVFTDSRGYFFESFSQREFDEKVFGKIDNLRAKAISNQNKHIGEDFINAIDEYYSNPNNQLPIDSVA